MGTTTAESSDSSHAAPPGRTCRGSEIWARLARRGANLPLGTGYRPDERALLLDAVDSNWIAPLGPHVDAFEQEMAAAVGVGHAVALSSGTAALHLALLLAGVGPGDEVLVPTLTFVATANAAVYRGATPVFVDSEPATWNLDPDLVAEELASRARAGERCRPRSSRSTSTGSAVTTIACALLCDDHGVPLIEDAAEALGATYGSRRAGSLGDMGVLSFNGNKIITTSGGGMLVTDREDVAAGHATWRPKPVSPSCTTSTLRSASTTG